MVITNTLAAGLTPHAPAGCTVSGQTLTCPLATLAAGGSGVIDLIVTVDPNAPTGTVYVQGVTITGDQTDPNPANNSASVQSTVARATDTCSRPR